MLRKNNSNPAICANNLIQIAKGEVPYDRIKGVSFAQLDAPISQAIDDITEDTEWMINTYEPRVEVEKIEVTPTDAQHGHFAISATINTTKEADDE